MDLLYGLQGVTADNIEDATVEDEIADAGGNEFSNSIPGLDSGRMPSPEELLSMLDGMTGLSDEDKESLRDELTKTVKGENQFEQPAATPFTNQALILISLLTLVALIFVFFGYKLYKSLMERERKREEKKKLKQMKKKK